MEILDERIVYQNGPFIRKVRWLRGRYPDLGILVWGLSGGWETVQEVEVIRPLHTFTVVEAALVVNALSG